MKKLVLFIFMIVFLMFSQVAEAGVYGDLVGESSFKGKNITVNQMIKALPRVGDTAWKDITINESIVEVICYAEIYGAGTNSGAAISFHFLVEVDKGTWVPIGFGMVQLLDNKRVSWICDSVNSSSEFGLLLKDFKGMNGKSFVDNITQLHIFMIESGRANIEISESY